MRHVVMAFVLSLSAEDLYRGFEAHHVLLQDGALVLDGRNWAGGKGEGRIVTDVIDLGGDDLLGVPVTVTEVEASLDSEAAAPGAVALHLRSGTTFFQAPGTWTDWAEVGRAPVKVTGRYVQVRITMTSSDPAVLPKVKTLKLGYRPEKKSDFAGKITVRESAIENIVRSPVEFGYERQDQADLAWVRKTFKLDEVIAGKKTEFEKLAALCTWVASRKNNREANWHPNTSHYPWNIRDMLRDTDGGTIYGHCASYCAVLITAAGSFGWQGRHIANEGYRRRSHEVPEIWINELRKWVYFDPSLDGTYYDAKTGVPLSILEMHNIFLKSMYPGGLVLGSLNEDQQKEKNAAIDWSSFPAAYKSDLWWYGEKKQEKEFWHWGQGLMTTGWLQMTPRNNFHSKPTPYFTRFGHGPGSEPNFPYWTDAQTPLRNRFIRNWHTRPRDWYWTLNQASMRLVRTAEDVVTVELGTSQPFFKRFVASVNGGKPETVTSPYAWTVKAGENRLVVNCEDEFGAAGLPSTVVIDHAK